MTVPEGSLTADDLAELDARKRLSDVLGDAASRRRARRRLGLSLADVAELCGLSVRAVQRREATKDGRDLWRFKRGSLETDAGYLYVQFIARAQGVDLS